MESPDDVDGAPLFMRNYVMIFVGQVRYALINPSPPPPVFEQPPQWFVFGTLEELEASMEAFRDSLDPAFFKSQTPINFGSHYVLCNKENIVEIISGFTGWEALIGDVIVTESPRDTWSHGH